MHYPIEGGWPSIEELKSLNYNIIYIDKRDYRKVVQRGQTFIVYRNGIYKLSEILKQRILSRRIDFTTVSPDFKKVFEYIRSKDSSVTDYDTLINKYQDDLLELDDKIVNIDGKKIDIVEVIENEFEKLMDEKSLQYNTEFLNAFKHRVKESVIREKEFIIKASDIYELLENYAGVKNVKQKSFDDIKKLLQKEINKDKEFPYKVKAIIDNVDQDTQTPELVAITLENIYPKELKKILKIKAYKELEAFKLEKRLKGYRIYSRQEKDKTRYYVIKGILDDEVKQYDSPQPSLKSAEDLVNKLVNNERLATSIILDKTQDIDDLITFYNSQLGFKPKEKVLRVLSYDKTPGASSADAYRIIESDTLYDFQKKFKSQKDNIDPDTGRSTYGLTPQEIDNILDIVNTPHKAKIFLLEFFSNNPNKRTLRELLNYINGLQYSYYYIVQDKNNKVRAIKIDPNKPLKEDAVLDEDKNVVKPEISNIPKDKVIRNIAKAIDKKLSGTGFQVVLMTQEEIKENFGEERASKNGFVTGNNIIINSTIADISTPIHEYIHVILGVIKAMNYNAYRRMITNCIDSYLRTSQSAMYVMREFNKIRDLYPNMSEMDVQEEFFADAFSEYILGNNKFGTFMEDNQDWKINVADFFDLSQNNKLLNFDSIFSFTLSSLQDILDDALVEQKKDKDYFANRFKLQRQMSNWLQREINDKKIREVCK